MKNSKIAQRKCNHTLDSKSSLIIYPVRKMVNPDRRCGYCKVCGNIVEFELIDNEFKIINQNSGNR